MSSRPCDDYGCREVVLAMRKEMVSTVEGRTPYEVKDGSGAFVVVHTAVDVVSRWGVAACERMEESREANVARGRAVAWRGTALWRVSKKRCWHTRSRCASVAGVRHGKACGCGQVDEQHWRCAKCSGRPWRRAVCFRAVAAHPSRSVRLGQAEGLPCRTQQHSHHARRKSPQRTSTCS